MFGGPARGCDLVFSSAVWSATLQFALICVEAQFEWRKIDKFLKKPGNVVVKINRGSLLQCGKMVS